MRIKPKTYAALNLRDQIYLVVATMPDGNVKPVFACDERKKADARCEAFHTIWRDYVRSVEIFNVFFWE